MNNILLILSRFATTWVLCLYCIYLLVVNYTNINIPLYVTNFIISSVVTIGIHGMLLLQGYKDQIQQMYPMIYPYTNILDILFHFIPLIHIIINKVKLQTISDKTTKKNRSKKNSLLLFASLIVLYLIYIRDLSKVYFNVSHYQILIITVCLYSSVLYMI